MTTIVRMVVDYLVELLTKMFATAQHQENQVDGAASGSAQAPGASAAPGVLQNITADSSSKVLAPVISNTDIKGDMNFSS